MSESSPGMLRHNCVRLTIRWSGPGMLRDLAAKLYDVSG